MREVKVGSLYKHFKGHICKVIAIAYDTEKYSEENKDDSRVVVYEHIESKDVWARPYGMFIEEVDHNKYPDVKQKYRFEEYEIEK